MKRTAYYITTQKTNDRLPINLNKFAKEWEEWIVFILRGIEETSIETTVMVKGISSLMAEYKQILKPIFGATYKHELLNNLFFHPYTKI